MFSMPVGRTAPVDFDNAGDVRDIGVAVRHAGGRLARAIST
jgi:hypothetical protein